EGLEAAEKREPVEGARLGLYSREGEQSNFSGGVTAVAGEDVEEIVEASLAGAKVSDVVILNLALHLRHHVLEPLREDLLALCKAQILSPERTVRQGPQPLAIGQRGEQVRALGEQPAAALAAAEPGDGPFVVHPAEREEQARA